MEDTEKETDGSAQSGKCQPQDDEELPEDEQYLMEIREELLADAASNEGIFFIENASEPLARLAEYLIFRHLSDALYDDRLEERIIFIRDAFHWLAGMWSDGKIETLAEIVRAWSNEYEYDTDKISELLDKITASGYN